MSSTNQVPLLGSASKNSFVRTLAAVVLPLLGLLLLSWGSLTTPRNAGLTTESSAEVAVEASSESSVKYFKESTMAAEANARALYVNPELKVLEYPTAHFAGSELSVNPELKVLAYPKAGVIESDLYTNPELKTLGYTSFDKATVQVVTGSEPRVLVFPEALDQGEHANPELKYLNYAPAGEVTRNAVNILRPYTQNR